ncbi:GAP family protein [Kribbella sp. NBC_01505]|uniref:GAP family protein n=1 Tax=Kribbella sp. NBC_01505 TaxID=2903580 RepID=UPI00386FC12B
MSTAMLGALVVLALLDSTSIGTLFVPIGLLLAPGRVRVVGVITYLLTIAVFYLVAGLAIAAGLGALGDQLGTVFESTAFAWAEVVVGVGLFALSFRFDPKRRAARGKTPDWSGRITKAMGSPGTLVMLALSAGVLELATMVTFLAAIGLVSSSAVSWPVAAALLTGYCFVMILPALVLLALRVSLSDRITPTLNRLNAWFAKNAAGATGWILAIVGFLIARDGFGSLMVTYHWFGQ